MTKTCNSTCPRGAAHATLALLLAASSWACSSGDADPGESEPEIVTDIPSGQANEARQEGVAVDELGYPTDNCYGFILDEGSWELQPGEDVDYCARLPMPHEFRDRDLVITGWAWNLGTTHHYFMEYSPNPFPGSTMDPVPCNEDGSQGTFSLLNSANTEGSKLVFGAGEGAGYMSTGGNHGRFIQADGHFRTSHHVINFTTEPITIEAKFKVCVKEASEVPHPISSLVCNTTAINVPEGVDGDAIGTCTAPFDMDIVVLSSHAHQHLNYFTLQKYDGNETLPEILYESTDWDSPDIIHLEEPLHLKKGEGITYTCNFKGPTVYRDDVSLPDADHCAAYMGYAYPAGERDYEVPPSLMSLALFPEQVAQSTPSIDGSPI